MARRPPAKKPSRKTKTRKAARKTLPGASRGKRTVAPELRKQLAQARAQSARLRKALKQRSNELAGALDQQSATSEILQVISSSRGALDLVFGKLLENATRVCGANFGTMNLYENGVFRRVAHYNMPEAAAKVRPTTVQPHPASALALIAATRRAVQIEDILTHAAYLDGHPTMRSLAAGGARTLFAVPMLKDGELLGTITIYRQEVRLYSDHEIELVADFARQAVIAIENARLISEIQESLERQTATADILKVIASSPSDVQPVFQAIAERSNRLVNALSTGVYSIEDGVVHLMAFTSTSPAADAVLKSFFPATLSERIWAPSIVAGKVFTLADTEAGTVRESVRDLARLRGWRSSLYVPLMRNGHAIGVISVNRAEPGGFAEHHVELLRTFADQAVIAIGNVRLFDEVQRKTRDLEQSLQQQTATADVLKVISRATFDLRKVLDTLTEAAVRLTNADHGYLFRLHDARHHLAASFGATPEFVAFLTNNPFPVDRGTLSGRVAYENRIVHITDAANDPDYTWGEAQRIGNLRSGLGVPLVREGTVIGILALYRSRVESFDDRQTALVATFADQAVIAIGNVTLFEQLQQRTQELSQSLEDLRSAQDRLIQTEKLASLGQLTAGIAHEIKNPLNFVNNFSALSAELIDEMTAVLTDAGLGQEKHDELDELARTLKSNLEKVVQHGKRADSIVKNMLLHSREGSGEQREADVNAIVDESLNLAYHGARAEKPGFNITLQRKLDPAAGHAEVFPQEITRVLLNIISNGFYAANRRAIDGANGLEPTLSAETRDLGDKVEIRIRDNGAGIPAEIRAKIFTPFFTTKPSGEGTGLGLSMSHDIVVKQHGGMIDVLTEQNAFTEFVITLPRRASDRK